MKTIQKFFIVFLLASVPFMLNAQEKGKKTETVKFSTSIDCQNCVNKIMTNLPQDKGIKDVRCDLGSKEVTVTFDTKKNDPANIRKSIEKLGFTAKVVAEEPAPKKDK
ncbi:MAG TPA: heavy metal-associated domain-containing protein [Bacteroidales bacterium]|nr:heavy metal-associated domain-containing protein [Bacteroidales bacterium]HPF01724.1 heavy metal-associated domain-containing protein [Bacteroidales bacterium]HPR11796.1 heavy metal-associated domain-containing protein [Bacteroidales bacterium]HRW84055.1 heavy metal-associated domain-containing protein [Bacteroidales bacterium]